MKNIYFIEAKSPGSHIFSRTPIPRLGTILLATILRDKGYNTKVFIEDISAPDWRLLDDADMVCISSITSTAPRAYQIADRFMGKGIPVVMGGAHPTFMAEESLLHADYVVRGEGEETIVELIEHLESGLPLNAIKGLSFRNKKNDIIHNPDRGLIHDLDNFPTPDFSLVYNWGKAMVIPIATSRGCPFACKFCSVIPMFGRRYRFKSIDRVIEEIRFAISLNPKSHIFFVDDNFAADKNRTKRLLRSILDSNLKIEWSAQMRTDIAKDPELINLMAETNCFSVYIGFESINPKTLVLYNKHQKLEDITRCIKTLKSHSIHMHGMFVFGADTDDIQTIQNTQKYAKQLGLDSIQFMMLTPLPGTPVFDELQKQGRIIHTDWNKYDAHHAVFEPKLMTAFELHVETLKAMAGFYSWAFIFRNLLSMDIFYTFIGLYGKRLIKDAIAKKEGYLNHIKEIIINRFDSKTERIRKYFQSPQKMTKSIILNNVSMGNNESRFFAVFFKKLGKRLVIEKTVSENCLTITPFVGELQNDISEDYYAPSKTIKLEAISLYRTCVNIGLMLNVNLKKIRTAYEHALASIGGNTFECNTVLVTVRHY